MLVLEFGDLEHAIFFSKVTSYDLSHSNFPFMHSRSLEIAGKAARATRITYVGELGWEIYLPVHDALSVWEEPD